MPRGARLDAPGTLHHVIVRGIEKQVIVADDADRDTFVLRMGDAATSTRTSIYAWALMVNQAHILIKSSDAGLSTFMRKFLTGYSGYFNRRHERHGHLFQNRYQSIVCEEEIYLLKLVSYIHLAPLRAGEVDSPEVLERYPWAGHAVLMGRKECQWQDSDYVLRRFARKEGAARKACRKHLEHEMLLGEQPALTGGGLIRSFGSWSTVRTMRRRREHPAGDERILGSSEFVRKIIEEAEDSVKAQLTRPGRQAEADEAIVRRCGEIGISPEALQGGSRRRECSNLRKELVRQFVLEWGLSLVETGTKLGISSSAVSQILKRLQRQ